MSAGAPEYSTDGSVEFVLGPDTAPVAIPSTARGAVIIPAHDEAGVIARTLSGLAPLTAAEVEVIVVCNGCTDDTAAIARRFSGVTVLELALASKTAAMNLGDETATQWPRLYLDGDIEIPAESVVAVFDALAQPGVLAARARYVYDASCASSVVRAYHRARSRVPAPPRRLWGAGGYATNEQGHRRFGQFPATIGDDSWFDAQFTEDEKRVVPTAPMRVRTPRRAVDMVAVLARRRRGALELGLASTGASRGRGLLRAIRGPRSAIDAWWYACLTLAARWRASRALRRGDRTWERDVSSRTTHGGTE